jgi:DNA-binding protein HU-beta
MNKTELTEKVSESAGLTKVLAGKVLNSILVVITGALQVGDEVRILGFGAFTTVKRAARTGRNPQNGKKIKIAARTIVIFRPGKFLKASAARTDKVAATASAKAAATVPVKEVSKAPALVSVKAPAKVAAAKAH